MSSPGPHPSLPPDFDTRRIPWASESEDRRVRALARGPWVRVHPVAKRPLHFGRGGDWRFDDPKRKYGALYVGENESCAFIEVYGDSLVSDPSRLTYRLFFSEELEVRSWARVMPKRALRIVDLTGPGLSILGLDERICAGSDYTISQHLSRALWGRRERPEGLCYRARHDPFLYSLTIFDKAQAQLRAISLGSLVDVPNRAVLQTVLDRYRCGLW